jgi:hypothetical protein
MQIVCVVYGDVPPANNFVEVREDLGFVDFKLHRMFLSIIVYLTRATKVTMTTNPYMTICSLGIVMFLGELCEQPGPFTLGANALTQSPVESLDLLGRA